MARPLLIPLRVLLPALPVAAQAQEAQARVLALEVTAVFLLLTLAIIWFAARRLRAVAEFYTAGHAISAHQNGWAIAGDYLSAASFLGVVGLIAAYGFDGLLYSVGFLAAYVVVLLLVAEPCRNLGQYTLADILAVRHPSRAVRSATALSALVVTLLYLSAQMLGGSLVLHLLTGLSHEWCAWLIGGLTVGYVLLAGTATITYVQVVKAVMLVSVTLVLAVLALWPLDFSLSALLDQVRSSADVAAHVTVLRGGHEAAAFLQPGLYFPLGLDRFSLCLALVLGTAGLPHILMRFFAVPTPGEARQSVTYAMSIIMLFYLLTIVLGLAAAAYLGPATVLAFDPGANLAVPLLAQHLGGGPHTASGQLLLALTAAVALTTIVAVVSGLLLSAADAVAHDAYAWGVHGGVGSGRGERQVHRGALVLVGVVAVLLSLGGRHHNVAHWVGLAFAVAASSNLPALLLSLYWRRCSTAGVVAGMVVGTGSAGLLILLSPNMGWQAPLFPLMNPGVVSIPLGFLAVLLVSWWRPDAHTQASWERFRLRRVTGIRSEG